MLQHPNPQRGLWLLYSQQATQVTLLKTAPHTICQHNQHVSRPAFPTMALIQPLSMISQCCHHMVSELNHLQADGTHGRQGLAPCSLAGGSRVGQGAQHHRVGAVRAEGVPLHSSGGQLYAGLHGPLTQACPCTPRWGSSADSCFLECAPLLTLTSPPPVSTNPSHRSLSTTGPAQPLTLWNTPGKSVIQLSMICRLITGRSNRL